MSNKRQAILFLIDTQGANVVGCYAGKPELGTPSIDKLAGEGVRFSAGYTCSPVCGPARSAIFTGLYPHSNGVLGNDMAPHLDLPTIGQRLTKAGIQTGYVGKWHLDGSDYFGDGRCPDGWDPEIWFDGRNYLESLPDDAARDLSREVLGPKAVAEHGITSEFTHAHRIADRAIKFIETHRDEDFFLVVSIDEPHAPFICPEPYVSSFEEFRLPVPNGQDNLEDKPLSQREWADYVGKQMAKGFQDLEYDGETMRHPRFFACNSYSDSQVGRVVEAIDQAVPEAFVTYTTDHGDMLGSHGLLGKGPAAYEEVTRVPFIVRWPGQAPAGVVSEGPVSHIDLVPTWLDFFGLDVPDIVQGRSLLPQIANPAKPVNEIIFTEFNRFEIDHDGYGSMCPIRAAFDGRFKLVLNLYHRDEFYDLQEDPGELRNLIDEGGEVRDRLMQAILDWMNRTRDPFRGPAWERRSWRDASGASSWGGPTRPRPFDLAFYPKTLLYDTGRPIEQLEYGKE